MEMLWLNLFASIVWGIIVYFWHVKSQGKKAAASKAVFTGLLMFIIMMIGNIWGLAGWIAMAIVIAGLYIWANIF